MSSPVALGVCCAVPVCHQDFLQVISMLSALDMHWPPSVKETYNAVSLANFNLELAAPECSVSIGYEAKWWAATGMMWHRS